MQIYFYSKCFYLPTSLLLFSIKKGQFKSNTQHCNDSESSAPKAPSQTSLEQVTNKDNKQTTAIPSQNVCSLSQDENQNKDRVPQNNNNG